MSLNPTLNQTITVMKPLISIVEREAKILANPIMLILKKEIDYEGERIQYLESESVAIAISQILASLRASTSSIVLLASQDINLMLAKDTLPLARSIIEGCINAVFIMTKGETVAKDALEHSVYKGFKNTDRTIGKGGHKVGVKRIPTIEPQEDLKLLIEKFTTKKGRAKNWTELSVPQRIEAIEPVFGRKCATSLSMAYLMVYSDASEIIHGSVTGAKIANGTIAFGNFPRTENDHLTIQESHLESALLSSFIALDSAMRAFCEYTNFTSFEATLDKQFEDFKRYCETEFR